MYNVIEALTWVILGFVTSVMAVGTGGNSLLGLLLGFGMMIRGAGLLNIMIFHHCAHGTVFRSKAHNELTGKLISAILLFKHLEVFRRDHLAHHRLKILLTKDDYKFTGFIVEQCRMYPGSQFRQLKLRATWQLISPRFHFSFFMSREMAAVFSSDPIHKAIAGLVWIGVPIGTAFSGHLTT
jgi:fatty acid desaturase